MRKRGGGALFNVQALILSRNKSGEDTNFLTVVLLFLAYILYLLYLTYGFVIEAVISYWLDVQPATTVGQCTPAHKKPVTHKSMHGNQLTASVYY